MKILLRVVSALCGLVILVYLGDALLASSKTPSSVSIQPMLAVPQKNGRYEFILDTPYQASCVHALAPHSGMEPCWYLERHKRPIKPM